MILSKGVQAAPAAFYPLSRTGMFMVLGMGLKEGVTSRRGGPMSAGDTRLQRDRLIEDGSELFKRNYGCGNRS
ncbi:hypothetical protein TNCV_1465091 [Trichonephila clavipes]|nr:hypothetical protein TNCV_1465091 [Trichonephila clavipes]